jgi:hypothetical protein
MNGCRSYATGWYSVSPAFTWWNSDAHRLAALKARREATRINQQDKCKKKENSSKIEEGTISIYA